MLSLHIPPAPPGARARTVGMADAGGGWGHSGRVDVLPTGGKAGFALPPDFVPGLPGPPSRRRKERLDDLGQTCKRPAPAKSEPFDETEVGTLRGFHHQRTVLARSQVTKCGLRRSYARPLVGPL